MDNLNNFVTTGIFYINNWLWPIISLMIFVITLINPNPLNYRHDATFIQIILVYTRRIILGAIPTLLLVCPLVLWLIYSINTPENSQKFLHWYINLSLHYLRLVLAAFIFGWLLKVCYCRYILPRISNLKRLYRVNVTSDKLSDVREEKERYIPRTFVPENWYKDGVIFLGEDIHGKPIYIPLEIWSKMHQQIIGPTRFGKGILIGVQAVQAIMNNACIFYIDPKGDDYLPHIMADAAKKFNRDFIYCDLNNQGIGGWHPFLGGTTRDKRARILMACGLEDTGRESDYYKIGERRILDKIMSKTTKIKGLMAQIESDAHYSENAKRLYGKLLEWSKISSLNPKGGGLNIEKSLLNGAVVYIKGSLDDRVVRDATRVLIVEIIQEAKRLKEQRNSHLTLIIDELRFLASNPVIDATATIAGLNANLILAYQSVADIRNLEDVNINASAAERSIDTNCQIKFLYGTQDADTAEYAESMSGDIQKLVTRLEHTEVGHSGNELWEGRRTIAPQKEAYITKNTMLSLRERIGVLFCPSELPRIVFTSYVSTEKNHVFDKQHLIKTSVLPEQNASRESENKNSDNVGGVARKISSKRSKAKQKQKTLKGISIEELD